LARRPTKVAAIALANKLARMAWAMMSRGERYKEPVALAAYPKRTWHRASDLRSVFSTANSRCIEMEQPLCRGLC
jgi:hypothetical protein